VGSGAHLHTQTDAPKHSVSAAAVIVGAHGSVLVVQRAADGRWELPGGILECDETVEDGLRREVFEETGMAIGIDRLTGIYKNLHLGVLALVFRCRTRGGRPRLSDETSAMRWMSLQQVVQHLDPSFAVRIRDALRTYKAATDAVIVRNHRGFDLAS
jgi:8-oxo-dGTP diphosphatase